MRFIQAASSVLLVMMIAASSQAAIIDMRIDFNNTAAVTDPNWNTINGAMTSDMALVNYQTGNTDDGVLARLVAVRQSITNHSSTNNWQAANPGPSWLDSDQNAAKDGVRTVSNAMLRLDFTGLDPDVKYTIEVISAVNLSGTYTDGLVFRVVGETTSPDTTWNAYQQGYVNGEWMTWTDVSPDATGKISLEAGKPSGVTDNLYLNAVRLYAIPEPMTLSLLALGGLFLARRRTA